MQKHASSIWTNGRAKLSKETRRTLCTYRHWEWKEFKRGGRDGDEFSSSAHVMSSVEKLETMLLMKFSRMMTARMAFQSVAFSPRSRQMDSSATLTSAGGLPIDRTSTKCCFFIDLTAARSKVPERCGGRIRHQHEARAREYKKERNKKAFSSLWHAAGVND